MGAPPRLLMLTLLLLTSPWATPAAEAAQPLPVEPQSAPAVSRPRMKPEAVKLPPRIERRVPAAAGCANCPDLTPGSCQIECVIGSHAEAAICANDGYKSSFEFRVSLLPGISNSGSVAATLAAGKRLYAVSGAASASFAAPPTGLYLDAGALAPQLPRVQLQQLAASIQVIRFEVDPDQAIAESNESNNAVDCAFTVVDAATAPKQPNLMLDPIQVIPASGNHQTAFKVWVKVRNEGTGYSSPFTVSCSPGVTNRHHTLAPNAEALLGGAVQDVASLPPGTHPVNCTLQTDQPEQSQAQHSRSASLTVQ